MAGAPEKSWTNLASKSAKTLGAFFYFSFSTKIVLTSSHKVHGHFYNIKRPANEPFVGCCGPGLPVAGFDLVLIRTAVNVDLNDVNLSTAPVVPRPLAVGIAIA